MTRRRPTLNKPALSGVVFALACWAVAAVIIARAWGS